MKKCAVMVLAVMLLGIMVSGAYALAPTLPEDPVLEIRYESLNDATVGKNYSHQFKVNGATYTDVKWSLKSGNIPGMSLSWGGVLSGIPSRAGVYNFTVAVERYYGTYSERTSTSQSITLVVKEKEESGNGGTGNEQVEGGTLSIDGTLWASRVGEKYPQNSYGELSGKATANGGTPPYKWSVAKGDLPKGLSLACSSTGMGYTANELVGPYTVLCGVAAKGGTYNFTLRVTDSEGQSAEKDLSVEVSGGDIDEIEIEGETVGAQANSWGENAYFLNYSENYIYVSEGGRLPFEWSLAGGQLPEGIKVGTSSTPSAYGERRSAEISGLPSAGKYNFVLQVTDADGRTARKAFSVVYYYMDFDTYNSEKPLPEYGSTEASTPLPVISGDFHAGKVGEAYSVSATASNGTAPYTWSVSYGDLPEGVSLTGATGQTAGITGTPQAEGVYNFVLKVTDANGVTNARTFVINVAGNASTANGNTVNENTGNESNTNTNGNNGNENNTNTPEGVSGSGGGGGGCNSSGAILGLMLTALIVVRKSRR